MFRNGPMRVACGLLALAVGLGLALASDAPAQGKKLKIGVIYDYTGPLAGGGSELHALGAKIMIDYYIKKGGVEGYQIEAVYADAQSKPDVAINEAVRLIEQEKVDMLLGFYSSAQCVPAAEKVEQLKKFMWITTCISSKVLAGRHLKYVFRAQPSGKQFGLMSTDFLAQNAKSKLGKDPKDVRVADRRARRQREDRDDHGADEGPCDGTAQRHERPPKRRRSGTERGARHYKLAGPCCQGPAGRSERPRLRRAGARTCPARRRRGSAPRGWSGEAPPRRRTRAARRPWR